MTQFLKTTIFILFVITALSCSKDDELEIKDTYIVEFGTVCGWCTGTGFIAIQQGEIEYSPNTCSGNQVLNKTKEPFNNNKWKELITSFDYDYFVTLDINVCNICFDGCDEIIKITHNDKTHEIRYNPLENIEGLETLQEKLREYLAEYYEAN